MLGRSSAQLLLVFGAVVLICFALSVLGVSLFMVSFLASLLSVYCFLCFGTCLVVIVGKNEFLL